MALTINTEIAGQVADLNCSYCYLFEPLRISVSESDLTAERLFIDLEVVDTTDINNVIDVRSQYGLYDINPGVAISIDLMKLARQYHNAEVYKYQSIADITNTVTGWQSVVSKYRYRFKIYSDITTTPVSVFKLPIIGGRLFKDFVAAVDENQPLTEAELLGVDLSGRWIDFPYIQQSLASPTANDSKPTIINTTQSTGCTVNGGFLIFKSRMGGWMTWGMDINQEREAGVYSGNLSVGMFESTAESGGDPYIPVDYTEISSNYGYQLKALSLLTIELKAVRGIHHSPAVFFMADQDSGLELMRKSGATTPVSSLASGGDFSVTLASISNVTQKTR